MAKLFLHVRRRHAIGQEQARRAVPQGVAGEASWKTGGLEDSRKSLLCRGARNGVAVLRRKDPGAGVPFPEGRLSCRRLETPEHLACKSPEVNRAPVAALRCVLLPVRSERPLNAELASY